MKRAFTKLAWTGLMALSLVSVTFAQKETRPEWQGRFVIKKLMPVVAPKMVNAIQAFVCIEEEIYYSELLPPGRGGITKTRAAIRRGKKGPTWISVSGVDPAYRIYQSFEKFGVMRRIFSWAGAEHILLGTVSFGGYTFESDAFPLHFKLIEDVGYVHLCGRGTVTTPEGRQYALGKNEGIQDFIAEIGAEDQLSREAASEALGWLARTASEKDQAIPALIQALEDVAMEVRRNAASSLGKIGDPRALEALEQSLKDRDEWVQEVAAHALKQIEQRKIEQGAGEG